MFRTTNFNRLFAAELSILDYDPPATPPDTEPILVLADTTCPDIRTITLQELGQRLTGQLQVQYRDVYHGEERIHYMVPVRLEINPRNPRHWTFYARHYDDLEPDAVLVVYEIHFRNGKDNIVH